MNFSRFQLLLVQDNRFFSFHRADRPTIIIFYRFSLAVGILAFYGSVVRLMLDTYLGFSPDSAKPNRRCRSMLLKQTKTEEKKIAKLKCL